MLLLTLVIFSWAVFTFSYKLFVLYQLSKQQQKYLKLKYEKNTLELLVSHNIPYYYLNLGDSTKQCYPKYQQFPSLLDSQMKKESRICSYFLGTLLRVKQSFHLYRRRKVKRLLIALISKISRRTIYGKVNFI